MGLLPIVFSLLISSDYEAYANKTSVLPGETIAFKVSDAEGSVLSSVSVPYTIHRVGANESVLQANNVSVRRRLYPANAYEVGCGWPTSLSLIVPSTWAPGLYVAHFGTSSTRKSFVDFVVRAATPQSAIVLQVPITTRAAYNTWGEGSLYATAYPRSNVVSLDRPDNGDDDTEFMVKEFIRWAERDAGYTFDYITSVDLHADSSILDGYQLFLTVGHDEYWSRPMRDHLDNHVHGGGNAAIFSGNTMYWQIRFAPDVAGTTPNRRIICYKKDSTDPVQTNADPSDDHLTTVRWHVSPVLYPSNRSIGLGYETVVPLEAGQAGGGVYGDDFNPGNPNPSSFKVLDGSSWVFDGTGFANGTFFGSEIIGYETDALVFWRLTNIPVGSDQAPNHFKMLARANLLQPGWEPPGWAVLGLFDYGGTVFNAGTIDWAAALTGDDDFDYPLRPKGEPYIASIAQITRNVLTRLSAPRTALQKNTMSVHRYYRPNSASGGLKFFMSTSPFVEANWDYDGVAFFAHPQPASGTVPLYQFYRVEGGVQYRYSRSSSLLGWTLEGPVFNVYSASATGRVPVYEYWVLQSDGRYRYYYSTDPGVTSGWTRGPIVFYAPASN